MRFSYTENLLNLAAVIYRPGDDVDGLLVSLAGRLQNEGYRLGGIVQRNQWEACGRIKLMEVVDLMTGQVIPISQNLGSGSTGCKLDQSALADAAQAVRRAIDENVELVIINKFGRLEASGQGLRSEIADAIMSGQPTLTAVSERVYPAWQEFTGGFGTTLLCDEDITSAWWHDVVHRSASRRRAHIQRP
jgi:nucleoside-triphosphatase THEP1